jgi:simple sugar transport system permease protein
MTSPSNVQSSAVSVADVRRRGAVRRATGALRGLVLVPIIVLVFVWAALFIPHFLSFNNIVNNILVAATVLGVVTIAETIMLIGGYMDVSLQSIVGLAPMVGAWLVAPANRNGLGVELNPYLALVLMFVLGGLVGLVNGLMVAKLKLPAFIVTLAMLILLQGFTLGISGGQTISSLSQPMLFLGANKFLDVPLSVWLMVAAFAIAAGFMRYHPTGRRIYALGGNAEAARAAGIRTQRLTIGLFVLGGVLAALGGLLLSTRIASVTANQGSNLIFTVFAASVIGGVSLNGGRGSIMGAATGVLLLGMIQNILVLSQVPSFWIDATYGAIILGALLLGSTELRSAAMRLFQRRTSTAGGAG